MAEFQIKKGTTIFTKDTPMTTVCLIEEGTVTMQLAYDRITLNENDTIGLIDLNTLVHSCDYIAETDVVVDSYPIKQPGDLIQLVRDDSDFAKQLAFSMLKLLEHISTLYTSRLETCDSMFSSLMETSTDYLKHCSNLHTSPKSLPGLSQFQPLQLSTKPSEYNDDYYQDLKDMFLDSTLHKIYDRPGFLIGFLLNSCESVQQYLDSYRESQDYLSELISYYINENHLDFLDLYSNLLSKMNRPGADTSGLHDSIDEIFNAVSNCPGIDRQLFDERFIEYEELTKSLEIELQNNPEVLEANNKRILGELAKSLSDILSFAKMNSEFSKQMHMLIEQYSEFPNKHEESDELTDLRAQLSEQFTLLYAKAFIESMKTETSFDELPIALKMFFLFGFISSDLCGTENTVALYNFIHEKEPLDVYRESNVYTFYYYLKLIYKGKKNPHRNMLDQTFEAYVDSLIADGSISASEKENVLTDSTIRVEFELENLFVNGQKMTYGRVNGYCPVLSEHDMIKKPDKTLLDSKRITSVLDEIRSVDFMAFCRESIFYSKENSIHNEIIQKEILPEMILLPNVGTRGILWQEIEGANRNTPGCMILPIMCLSDLKLVLLRLTGEFRWEMCKRMQGVRWNDVTSPSLTSEYFDYLQFYRKNSDLSADAKEKCKLQLQRTRNRFRENFLLDYATFVLYESKGLPKLNKVSRKIFMRYCTPSREYREALGSNPIFTPLLNLYENKRVKEVTRLERIIYKIERNRNEVPADIKHHLDLLNK